MIRSALAESSTSPSRRSTYPSRPPPRASRAADFPVGAHWCQTLIARQTYDRLRPAESLIGKRAQLLESHLVRRTLCSDAVDFDFVFDLDLALAFGISTATPTHRARGQNQKQDQPQRQRHRTRVSDLH